MKDTRRVSTTVKVPSYLYDEFKITGIRNKISLQVFVEKCINLFISNDKFKQIINDYSIPPLESTETDVVVNTTSPPSTIPPPESSVPVASNPPTV